LHDYDGAIQCFTKSYELDKDVHFLNQICLSYYYLNQVERSFEYIDRAIKVNPKNTESLITKSRIIGLKNFGQAIDLLEAAIKIDKNDFDAWEAKGNLLWMNGNEEDATKCFAKIKGKKGGSDKPHGNKKDKNIFELIKSTETKYLEFKSSLSFPHESPNNIPQDAVKAKQKEVEESTLKTIVSFLNTDGGEVIIGVSDKKEIHGLDKDYEILKFDKYSNSEKLDKWRLYLDNLIRDRIGKDVSSNYIAVINEECNGKILARLVIKKSSEPQYLSNYNDRDSIFFIRNNSGTQMLNTKDAHRYILRNFSTGK
jgi:predicted HTH transcriptional regulator